MPGGGEGLLGLGEHEGLEPIPRGRVRGRVRVRRMGLGGRGERCGREGGDFGDVGFQTGQA